MNTVVAERYTSIFWRNGHEERVQKLGVFGTKRDLTFRRPQWSFKMVVTDPSDIPIISVRSLTVTRRFLRTNSFTSVDVDGHPERSK